MSKPIYILATGILYLLKTAFLLLFLPFFVIIAPIAICQLFQAIIDCHKDGKPIKDAFVFMFGDSIKTLKEIYR